MNHAHTIQVYSGARVDPLRLRPEDIHIGDIAHSLAMQCRFTGHTTGGFYSVAEHSVRVTRYLDGQSWSIQAWGLLHDAGEAYLRDIPSPLKSLPEFARYRKAECDAQVAIAKRFGLRKAIPSAVLLADKRLLATEARDLMAPPTEPWLKMPKPLPERIEPWSWEESYRKFMLECARLGIE